jgi:uncharacterized tellurite resistance protein B-like protein
VTLDDPGQEFIAGLTDEALEALVETMVLVVYADGVLSASERERFASGLGLLTSGRLAGAGAEELLARVAAGVAARGREASLAAIKRRLPDARSRLVALVLATDMAAADGTVRETERQLVLELAHELEIPAAEAQQLLTDASPDAWSVEG